MIGVVGCSRKGELLGRIVILRHESNCVHFSEQSFIVSKTVEVYKFLPGENGGQEFLLNFCGVEREFEFEFPLPRDEERRGSREVACVIRRLRQALYDFIFENYSDDSGGSRASINQVHATLASLAPGE